MSDDDHLSGGRPTPPPPPAAPPAQPYQPPQPFGAAPSYPQPPSYPQTPSYPQAPSYPTSTPPTQAYPGAVPTAAGVQPYGAPPQQQAYGAAYPAPIYPASRPTSGLAITSLICGIAGIVLFWAVIPLIASIIAVITGHMALRQTKRDPSIGGRGMAFAGLIMGYIMVAVLAVGIVTTVFSFLFLGAFTLPFIFAS
ncbi:DUF4190 domain-containing protein [Microbacterium sp. 1.5R]|uniref:DUF4190 domain-containing protein n=1 Tax=Microbacterium sp. 1.5R TaxID=1916917 RepID=UPI0021B49152|nr:DUF4190 domain-containing protein [Microbacterium sp. 1.5R]